MLYYKPEIEDIEVEVTTEDIKAGLVGDPYHCPIARAIKRRIPGIHVVVSKSGVTTSPDGVSEEIAYNNSPEAKNFIEDFDHERKVKPFTFKLTGGRRLKGITHIRGMAFYHDTEIREIKL